MSPSLQFLDTRERYLPMKSAVLWDRMLRDPRLSAEERRHLAQLCDMVEARFHFEFRAKLERLKDLYDPFDPDRDSLTLASDVADEPARREELARAFEELLLAANYVEMPPEQVETCVEFQSRTGLVVKSNLTDYADLRVFYRGIRHDQRSFRPRLTPWKITHEPLHVFTRIALLVRLTKPQPGLVYLKLFKNAVAEDLEMLLPYVRIRMRMFDHLKISSSVAGGVATAASKAFTAAILSPWMFLLILSGFTGAFARGVFSFFSQKTRYMQALTASLYFQNLANNSSVLAHLVDCAETEECKELLLAYFLLYVERERDYTMQAFDRRVEQWLKAEFALDTDFEIDDAVRKLEEKELLVRRPAATPGASPAESVLKVLDLPATLRRLEEVWDGFCRFRPKSAGPGRK